MLTFAFSIKIRYGQKNTNPNPIAKLLFFTSSFVQNSQINIFCYIKTLHSMPWFLEITLMNILAALQRAKILFVFVKSWLIVRRNQILVCDWIFDVIVLSTLFFICLVVWASFIGFFSFWNFIILNEWIKWYY